jgi:hypothetical protein
VSRSPISRCVFCVSGAKLIGQMKLMARRTAHEPSPSPVLRHCSRQQIGNQWSNVEWSPVAVRNGNKNLFTCHWAADDFWDKMNGLREAPELKGSKKCNDFIADVDRRGQGRKAVGRKGFVRGVDASSWPCK